MSFHEDSFHQYGSRTESMNAILRDWKKHAIMSRKIEEMINEISSGTDETTAIRNRFKWKRKEQDVLPKVIEIIEKRIEEIR